MEKDHIQLILIEDDHGDAFLINEILSEIRNTSFTIHSAENLRSATDLLVKSRFDIILTDLGLPDSQGMSTLETIMDLATGTPVIVLTGLDDTVTGNHAVEMGAQDYLVKGTFDPPQLERAIRYAISRNGIEEELRASETRMRTLFENGPDAYFLTDLYGNIQDANHVAEKLTGYKRVEFIGKNLIKLGIFPKNQIPKVRKTMAHLSLGMAVGPEEFLMLDKNHREIHVEMKFFPVELMGETVVYASATDITQKKQAAEREKQYYSNMQLLAEASMEMIQFSDSNQVLDYISDKLLGLTGKNSTVVLSDISDNIEQFSIRSVRSNTRVVSYIEKLLKKKVLDLSGRIDPDVRDQIGTTRLIRVNNDLQQLSGGILNKTSSRLIQEFINLKEIYVMSIMKGGRMFGHMAIFTEITLDDSTIRLIETFINQSSIILERITYQEALHESEERYKVLFDSSPQGIAVIGPGNTILTWNKQMLDLLAMKPKEFISMDIPGLYEDINDRIRLYEIFEKKGIVRNFEARMVRLNGETFVGNISMAPISFEGKSCRLVVISDITANKLDEEERKKLYKAIEQSPSMVMITNAQGIIEYANHSFCKTTGFREDEILGSLPSILKSGVTPAHVYAEMWQKVKLGENWKGILQNKTKEGRLFWANLQVFPITDENNNLSHFVGITEDITEKKLAEEELITAKLRAEESDKLKSAFLTNMSHEIRTPMNAILGFSELLSSPDHDEDKKRDFVDIIQSRGRDLMQIINNLIDVSKIESGQVYTNFSLVAAKSLISTVYGKFEGAQKSDVILRVEIPDDQSDLEISTDPTHLNRILSNLVENAIKYTDEGKVIIGYNVKDNECTFFVHDTGIGIHPNKSSIIFNRFMQADVTDPQARGGNGLGLTIARDLTEILDGKIWLESEIGKGSSFYVSMPIRTATENAVESLSGYSLEKSVDWSNRTLLVAEDDLSNYMVLKHFLDPTGIRMLHAKNGLLALDAFKSNGKFDMILMDLKMPLMNGFEATRVIRSMNREIPIVALTASAKSESYDQCLEAGCNEYLSKPINHEELIRTMNRYFES